MAKSPSNAVWLTRIALWLAPAALALALPACADDALPIAPNSEVGAGQLGLELQVGSGIVLDEASYSIVGPAGFSRSGALDLTKSTQLTALIGGLPVGGGFSLTLTASSTSGDTKCSGSASFAVSAGETTVVSLPVSCRVTPRNGGVVVGGEINICPVLDELSTNPNEVNVGGSIALTVAAHDSDSGPSPISYVWSASRGTLHSAGSNATLSCTTPGLVDVSVSVGDGTADCLDTLQVQVQCTGTTAAQPAPLPAAFAPLLGAALLALGARQARRRRNSSSLR